MVCYNCFQEKSSYGPCPFCGYDPAGAEEKYPLALKAGSILNGRYTVGRVIGQGGFGITYIAQDYQTKERVAIKEYFPSEFAGRSGLDSSIQVHSKDQKENFEYGKEQFLQEAKTLAAFIGDEHIVRIYSYFEENNTAYFVMEYVDGFALDKYMAQKGGRLSIDEANYLLLPLMQSLDKVHSKGIIHRDIAPDNIIVTKDGKAKLIDFGAARYSTGEKSKSLDVILKHGFAPKEQYMRRGRQGPFTDIYALAATYYYAITGKVPPDAIERTEDDSLFPPSSLGIKIPEATEDALFKALEVNASERYQSMREFYQDMASGSGFAPDTDKSQTIHGREADRLGITASRTEKEAKERAERLKRELLEAEKEAARLEQERLEREAREAAARRERERKEREAQEEAARLERERIERERKEEEARKKAERLEAERKAQEEAERKKREAREAEERRKKELAENKAREEAERQEKLRLEKQRREEEKRLAAEKKKQEAEEKERLRQEAVARRKAEQEQQRLEAERQKREREEQKRIASEQKKHTASEKKVSSKKKPLFAIIAALLVAAVAVGYFINSGAKKPDEETSLPQETAQPAITAEQAKPTAELPEQLEPAQQDEPVEQTEDQIESTERIEEQTKPAEEKTEQSEQVEEQTEQTEQVEQFEETEPEKTPEDYYAEGITLQAAGEWDAAITAFTEAGDYEDSGEHIQEIQKELKYQEASELLNEGQYREALSAFEELKESDFKDSDVQAEKIRHLAAYRAQVWADPQIGDILTYGHYEQDNDLENGKEEIEWTVLDREDNRILVISRYGLDCQPYDTSRQNITWESCSIRAWLNSLWGNGFKTTAFNSEEQARIPTVTLSADQNPKYDTSSGNDTTDNIFLLSIPEADKYFSNDTARMCEPTAYAVAQGCMKNGNGWWWLRSPGRDSYYSAYVDHGGSVQTGGVYTSSSKIAVRPAMWIDFSTVAEKYRFEVDLQTVGKTVTFGHYEQDNDLTNGKEPIEWIVLDAQNGKSLLISRYGLDSQLYDTKPIFDRPGDWEKCSLRNWLNGTYNGMFFKEAFTVEEQNTISVTSVDVSNEHYGECITLDRVFLLNSEEAGRYFANNNDRVLQPTSYAQRRGAYTNPDGACWWWLRSMWKGGNGDCVSMNGSTDFHSAHYEGGAVRPAIWLNWE